MSGICPMMGDKCNLSLSLGRQADIFSQLVTIWAQIESVVFRNLRHYLKYQYPSHQSNSPHRLR